MKDKKHWINIILFFAGVVIVVLYSICEESCRYLRGSIFNIDLKYLGLFYMGILTLFNILKRELIFLFLLSLGTGAELYLIGFQIKNSIYCSYCLLFGAIIFLLFLLNFERTKKVLIIISIVIGFIMFSFLFESSVTPVYAEERRFTINVPEDILLPSFGNSQVKVRLYTDYFCGPCKSLEPQLEHIITDLVKKNIITIAFIDTPIHAKTTLYARYFLYILNEKNELVRALRARAVLFDAAKNKITEKEKLEAFLRKKGVKFKPFDTKPTFSVLSSYLKEDRIDATPTCVICSGGKKDRFTGPLDIIKALNRLRESSPR
ncbi:MAG: hypothetical protein AB1478_09195 [Nitrospirota bacterium]